MSASVALMTAFLAWVTFSTAYVVRFFYDLDPTNFVLLGLIFYAGSHCARLISEMVK